MEILSKLTRTDSPNLLMQEHYVCKFNGSIDYSYFLANYLVHSESLESLPEKIQIRILTGLKTILYYHANITSNPCDFVDSVMNPIMDIIASKLKLSEANKMIQSLCSKDPSLVKTYQEEKLIALTIIKEENIVNGKHIGKNNLIIGSGPVGLTQAVFHTLLDHPFKLIEKRSLDKNPRQNVLTLGKEESMHIFNLLTFLGLTDPSKLETNASYDNLVPDSIQLTIGELENRLLSLLKKLNQDQNPIDYDSQVTYISETGKVTISKKRSSPLSVTNFFVEDKQFNQVIACDGANSETATMLNISSIEKARPSHITYVNGDNSNEGIPFIECALYKIRAVVEGIFLYLVILADMILHRNEPLKSAAKVLGNMVPLVSSAGSKSTYFEVTREKITKEQAIVNYRKNFARMDFLWTIIGNKHKLHDHIPMVISHGSIDVHISERTHKAFLKENTTFAFCGDAAATTDPLTGNGCESGLLHALTFANILENNSTIYPSWLNTKLSDIAFNTHLIALRDRGLSYFPNSHI